MPVLHPLALLDARRWKESQARPLGADVTFFGRLPLTPALQATAVLTAFEPVEHVFHTTEVWDQLLSVGPTIPALAQEAYVEARIALEQRRRNRRFERNLDLELRAAVLRASDALNPHQDNAVRSTLAAIRGVFLFLSPKLSSSGLDSTAFAGSTVRSSLRAYALAFGILTTTPPYSWWWEAVQARLAFQLPTRSTDVRGRH